MNEIFTNFSLRYFNFERFDVLFFVLLAAVFVLLEIFPGRRLSFSLIKLRKFIDSHLIQHLISAGEKKRRLYIRTGIVGIVWMLLIIALANPRWDFTEIEAFKPNINLVFLVDISKSMDAKDEKPSRIERAKQEIKDILKNINGVNYGLVAFAEQASVISPLTDDKTAIEYYLPSINTDLVGVQGSNIKAGVDTAVNMLSTSEGSINYIVLLTDGDFQDKANIEIAKQKLKNIKIFAFAFGTQQGAPIEDPESGFIRDKGKLVISRIEPENLIELCGKDFVYKSTYLDDDVMKVKSYIDKDISVQQAKYRSMRVWNDRFYLPLILAMIILAFYFRKGSVFPVIILLLVPLNSFAQETAKKKDNLEYLKFENIFSLDFFRNKDQRAYNRFKKGEYEDAYGAFSKDYNKGVTAYKLKEFAEAEKYFSKDSSLDSLYNLGNAQISQLKAKEAIETYEKYLKLDPTNKDAKFNLELAKKLLNEQNRADKNNQQQDQQNSSQQDQQKDRDSSGNSGNKNDKSGKEQDNFKNAEVNPINSGFGSSESVKSFNNQLKIDAQKMFSKISGDPTDLIKSRVRQEQGNKKINKKNIRPW